MKHTPLHAEGLTSFLNRGPIPLISRFSPGRTSDHVQRLDAWQLTEGWIAIDAPGERFYEVVVADALPYEGPDGRVPRPSAKVGLVKQSRRATFQQLIRICA